jgi:hypothetical protein
MSASPPEEREDVSGRLVEVEGRSHWGIKVRDEQGGEASHPHEFPCSRVYRALAGQRVTFSSPVSWSLASPFIAKQQVIVSFSVLLPLKPHLLACLTHPALGTLDILLWPDEPSVLSFLFLVSLGSCRM